MSLLRLAMFCGVSVHCLTRVNSAAVYTCELEPIGAFTTTGTLTFTQDVGSAYVRVEASGVSGLPPGTGCTDGSTTEWGVHVHYYGAIDRGDGSDAGAHFNPLDEEHGCYDPSNPTGRDRKAGDLGNIDATGSYLAETNYLMSLTSESPLSIIGRSVIVHECQDTCERSAAGDSSAGARVAQCVIGVSEASTDVIAAPDSGGDELAVGLGTAVAIAFCSTIFGALLVYAVMHSQKGVSDPFESDNMENMDQDDYTNL